jgi:SAM-dependent methyltransferase
MNDLTCPACNSSANRPLEVVDVFEQHRLYAPNAPETQQALNVAASETALKYQMVRCGHCGLEFCEPRRAPSVSWYHLTYRTLNLFLEHRWEFDEVLRRIPRGARIFEFGCGSGSFLLRCKENGVEAAGMDFSEDAVADCLVKGLNVTRMDLNAPAAAPQNGAVPQMAAFHAVEHIDRPASLFAHAAARAADSAHLWISVPSDRRPTRRFGVRDFLDQPPHHMTRWTPDAFREIGRQYGWKLVEVIYEPKSFRTAVWAISVYSPSYVKWSTSGRFGNPLIERAYRALVFPGAVLRHLTRDRHTSGFSMLAHFAYHKV